MDGFVVANERICKRQEQKSTIMLQLMPCVKESTENMVLIAKKLTVNCVAPISYHIDVSCAEMKIDDQNNVSWRDTTTTQWTRNEKQWNPWTFFKPGHEHQFSYYTQIIVNIRSTIFLDCLRGTHVKTKHRLSPTIVCGEEPDEENSRPGG